MRRFYGVLFALIGLFNMYIGFMIYDSDYYKIIDFLSGLFKSSQNYFPLIVFAIGLIYLLIGIIIIFKKNKKLKASNI
jgi:hypothetical protein